MTIRQMVLVSLFAALIVIGAQFTIPIGPVPHTLQIFFVLLAGVVLGPRWGALSVLVYILLGVLGLPVFAGGKAGAAVLVGPTGGFLVAFVVCAFVIGLIFEKIPAPGFITTTGVMLLGLGLVYAIGLAGFLLSFKYFLHKPMTVGQALTIAVYPFMPFDMIKTLIAGYLGVKVRKAVAYMARSSR